MKKNFVVLLFGVCLCVFGQESQTFGDFEFIVNGAGSSRTITITGYTGSASILRIPSTINNIPVTEIATQAIGWNDDVVEVILPDTLVSIGTGAFISCSKLEKINVPESVTGIGDGAFDYTRIYHRMDQAIIKEWEEKFDEYIFISPW